MSYLARGASSALVVVSQYLELRWFYPGEALLVAPILAVLPYFLLRGAVNHFSRRTA
jgi:hypothetical protein